MSEDNSYECPNCYTTNKHFHVAGCDGTKWTGIIDEDELIDQLSDNSLDSVMRSLKK